MAMFIAACGSYTTTGGGGYGSGSTNPPATVIHTATVTFNGQSVTVRTNAAGRTL
jgi:hypothetical protein